MGRSEGTKDTEIKKTAHKEERN